MPFRRFLVVAVVWFISLWIYETANAQQSPSIFVENEKSGIKDADGEILVPAEYERLGWSDGFDLFVDNVIGYHDENWGLISAKNKIITSANYYELWPVHKDLIIASRKGKFSNHLFYGALNSRGEAVVDFKYSSIDKIVDLLIVSQNEDGQLSYGLLNEKNQFLLDPVYSKISHFANDLYIFSDYEQKSGLIKSSGDIIVPLTLDSIGSINKEKAKIFDSGKEGLIDIGGSVKVQPLFKNIKVEGSKALIESYDTYTIVDDQNNIETIIECDSLVKLSPWFYAIYRNNHIEITDSTFQVLIKGTHLQIGDPIHNKIILISGGKYGVMNFTGDFFIPLDYDLIHVDQGYFYLLKDDYWSVINKFGRTISKKKFEAVKPMSENLIAVKRRGYWGFIDFQGDLVIGHKFDDVSSFKHLLSKVKFLDAYGVINQFGDWIVQPVYDDIIIHEEGISEARSKSRIDLINRSGDVFFQTYNSLRPYGGGFIEETAEGKIGFIMRDGQIVKHPVFDEISFTAKDSILIAREDNYVSLATKDGQRFYSLSGRFEEVLGLSEDFVGIKLDGKYGFVDLKGNLRIANRYDSVRLYSDGMAAFFLRGNWGYIDKGEKLRVQPIYESDFDFQNGTAIVVEDGKYGVIDKDGKYLIKTEFDLVTRNEFGSFIVKSGEKYGIWNADGKRVASVDYSIIDQVSKNRVIVQRRGLYGVTNETGRFIIPMMYNNISSLSDKKYLVVKEGEGLKTKPL